MVPRLMSLFLPLVPSSLISHYPLPRMVGLFIIWQSPLPINLWSWLRAPYAAPLIAYRSRSLVPSLERSPPLLLMHEVVVASCVRVPLVPKREQ